MAKLSLRHVSKRYPNGFWAVKDFNLEMEDGEFVILTGSPKCGKSTVLRMIAGAEDVTEGILELDGKPINDVEPKDREIAMVFQYYSLYKNMTVYDNLSFGMKLKKMFHGADRSGCKRSSRYAGTGRTVKPQAEDSLRRTEKEGGSWQGDHPQTQTFSV